MQLASQCAMVAITDGSKGSSICTLGRLLVCAPRNPHCHSDCHSD